MSIIEKHYKTLDEIIQDPIFKENVRQIIIDATKTRRDRPNPPSGFRYKRDWYDRMVEGGALNATFFLKNIKDIWEKRSSLSSEFRHIILPICNDALQKTVLYKENLKTETDDKERL